MKKKSKETSKERELRESWEAIMKKHSKPLERGAKSFGIKMSSKNKPKDKVEEFSDSRIPVTLDKFKGSTSSKATQKYTGNLIIGIAIMHKSNAVPILNEQAAKEVASMRRN